MTDTDFTPMFRGWIAAHQAVLGAQGIECESGENPESAGSDPVMWLDLFNGVRGGRLALWRGGEVELDVADLDSGQAIPRHFVISCPQDIVPFIDRLLEWTEAGEAGNEI
ncbi:hypothetical protein OG892_10750 [Streptomyces sp. NBC_00341]|uniref:hypothetical protein n=1 Tax=Streptomyces sp. NBC_00341 TaxID=2975717 RepID=UPI00308A5F12|nr:hypothetical protein OG892_10750 [Streptomyces sp. NBC_00341]